MEHFDEEIVDTNFQGGPAELQDHEQPFRHAASCLGCPLLAQLHFTEPVPSRRPPEPVPHVDQPLDSQLEEAVEDILRYAAELQQAARRRSGALCLAAAPAVKHVCTQACKLPSKELCSCRQAAVGRC